MNKHLASSAAVGSVFGIGDGEMFQAPVFDHDPQALHNRINLQGRTRGCENGNPADGIKNAFANGEFIPGEIQDIDLVGGHIQFKRGALSDLAGEIPRRAEGQPYLDAGIAVENPGDFL